MPPAMVGPAPSIAPPLPFTPFTPVNSCAVSNSQITLPSVAEYARRRPSTPPENTAPGITVTAADCAGLQEGRSPQSGGGAAQTLAPVSTFRANRPPPALGSATMRPIPDDRVCEISETAAYMFLPSYADPH